MLLTTDPSTTSFTFFQRDRTKVNGNAVLDYVGNGRLSNQTVKISETEPGKSRHERGTVYWVPTQGIQTENSTTGLKGSIPPMVILLHELGHSWLFHNFGGYDWQDRQNLFADEEQMIIDKLESPASLSLGFGRRDNHYNVRKDRETALEIDLHIKDEDYPNKLRENKTFKYYYQTTSPLSDESKK